MLTLRKSVFYGCHVAVVSSATSRSGEGLETKDDAQIFIFDDLSVDYFSFAGQSNAIGHTTSEESIGRDGAYWGSLMSLFNESDYIGTTQSWIQRLYDTIQSAHTHSDTPTSAITFLTDEAMKLQAMGLLSELNQPLSFGK